MYNLNKNGLFSALNHVIDLFPNYLYIVSIDVWTHTVYLVAYIKENCFCTGKFQA